MKRSRIFALLAAALLALTLAACAWTATEVPQVNWDGIVQDVSGEESAPLPDSEEENEALPDEHGVYTTAEDVARYLHVYGRLPENFITKKEAEALGWTGGSLAPYAPGKCIGGSYFGNYEGLLPEKPGRSYAECDIDTLGASGRGAKRLVYSNDGLIYYTEDHYESFTLLYGEDES